MSKRFLLVVPDPLMEKIETYRLSLGLKTTSEAMRRLMSERLARVDKIDDAVKKAVAKRRRQKPEEGTVKDKLRELTKLSEEYGGYTELKGHGPMKDDPVTTSLAAAVRHGKEDAAYPDTAKPSDVVKAPSLMSTLQVGPTPRAPGSMLKQKKGK